MAALRCLLSKMKIKITIKRVLTEDYEMTLDKDSLMEAFDEARQLVAARNLTSKIGRFFITKIDEVKDK